MNVRNQSCIPKAIEECLADLASRKYSAQSIRSYQKGLQRFSRDLAEQEIKRIQDVTLAHVEAFRLYLTEHSLSLNTVDLYLRSVKVLFNYLTANNFIFINPAERLRLPRIRRKIGSVPTVAEMEKLLEAPDTSTLLGIRDRAILEIFYSCGLRREELTMLTISAPDLNHATLRVMGKNSKERVVPLGKQALFRLKQYLENARPALIRDPDEQSLWLGKNGTRISSVRVLQLVKGYAAKAEIKTRISAHSLRRACATHMLGNGAHPVQIQMLLGHASLENLSQYLRVTITEMKKMHQGSRPGQ